MPIPRDKWAAAFLRGQAKGCARGNVPVAALNTAVRLAFDAQVSPEIVTEILATNGYRWDADEGRTATIYGQDLTLPPADEST